MIRSIKAGVFVALLGHLEYVSEARGRYSIRLCGCVGQDDVQAHQELLKVHLKVRTLLVILERLHCLMHHGGLGIQIKQLAVHEGLNLFDAQCCEMLKEPLVTLLQHWLFRRDVLHPVVQFLQLVARRVQSQGVGQVVGQTDVIDDVTALFTLLDTVGASNGL